VLNSDGRVVETFHRHGINGTVAGNGKTVHRGTVLRLIVITPDRGLTRLIADSTIGSGFAEQTNSSAGPAALASPEAMATKRRPGGAGPRVAYPSSGYISVLVGNSQYGYP
jgi:hypothetical protein